MLWLVLWLACNEGGGCAMTGLLCAVLGGTSEAFRRLPGSAFARSWTRRREDSHGALLSLCYVLLLWGAQSGLPGRQTGALLGVRGENTRLLMAATI